MPANPNKVLDLLPDSTLASISGQNLKSYWDFYTAAVGQDAQSKKQLDQSLQGIKTQTGIDIDADVFAWMTGDHQHGLGLADRLIKVDPLSPLAARLRAELLSSAGRYEEALAEHATALRLDPEGYEVNAAAARCYMPMRRYADAVACLEKSAKAIETDFWALGMAIQCHEALGDVEGAKSAARRALERVEKVIVAEPDHGLAIGWGVVALVALHDAERANEWASRAMLLDPDYTNLMFNLACSMVTLGEMDQAIELLAPILERVQRQNLIWFATDTSLDPIREDPRYQALVAQAEARLAATA